METLGHAVGVDKHLRHGLSVVWCEVGLDAPHTLTINEFQNKFLKNWVLFLEFIFLIV